ncbi:MAG: hypothetical protein IJU92_04365 [Spirochaetaceae bacterium]|nr:hypothetical protein [Spirochaetaceae bacterium]
MTKQSKRIDQNRKKIQRSEDFFRGIVLVLPEIGETSERSEQCFTVE